MADDTPRIVAPSAVPPKSYFHNVVALFQRVVPDGRQKSPPRREPVRFVKLQELIVQGQRRIYIIVAYRVGAQVWLFDDKGNAHEIFSLTDEVVDTACLLQDADDVHKAHESEFRPLFIRAHADMIYFHSLVTHQPMGADIQCKEPPLALAANRHAIAIMSKHFVELYSATDFAHMETFDCVAHPPSAQRTDLHLAISDRFLAFPSSERPTEVPLTTSELDMQPTPMQTAANLAAETGSRLMQWGNRGMQHVSKLVNGGPRVARPAHARTESDSNHDVTGMIKVVDSKTGQQLALFKGHYGEVNGLRFDESGTLLAVSDVHGNDIYIYQLAHMAMDVEAPSPIYRLNRGLTPAIIQNMSFSGDGRWIAVASQRGTVHLFPIHPNGGPISRDTHVKSQVSNVSPFLLSSGLHELQGRHAATETIQAKIKLRCAVTDPDAEPMARDLDVPEATPTSGGPKQARAAHAILMTAFQPSSLSRQRQLAPAWQAPASSHSEPGDSFSILACSRIARLGEFQLRCFAASDSEAVQVAPGSNPHSLSSSPSTDAVASLASNLFGTMGHVVDGMRGYLGPSYLSQDVTISDATPRDGIKVSYVATRQWDCCTTPMVLPAKNYHGEVVALMSGGRDEHLLREKHRNPVTRALEKRSSNPPHRRIWMGPQFTLKRYATNKPTDASSTSADAAPAPAPERSLFMQEYNFVRAPLEKVQFANDSDMADVTWTSPDNTDYGTPNQFVLNEMLAAITESGAHSRGDDGWGSLTSSHMQTSSSHRQGTAAAARRKPNFASKPKPNPRALLSSSSTPTDLPSRPGRGSPPGRERSFSRGSSDSLPMNVGSSSAINVRRSSPNGQPTFRLGTSPESPLSRSPEGLSTSPTSGLGVLLGDADADAAVPRVHSIVSLENLQDAFQEDEPMFRMDRE